MAIYQHYKGKLYRYHQEVKHSETLEDLILYDCHYENELAKTWVRPKDNFFSQIELDSQWQPRFKKVEPEIETHSQLDDSLVSRIIPILTETQGAWEPDWFHSTVESHSGFCLQFIRLLGKDVGFKLGYQKDRYVFYSWLGGVLPEYRGLGLATTLMQDQHRLLVEKGYQVVQTQTMNRYKAMLLLNIKMGFEIVGVKAFKENQLRILMEKRLTPP